MANLLYVTSKLVAQLRTHPAYQFWSPIIQTFPKRIFSLEDRAFYERDIEAEEGIIYLTVDMSFVYCRNNMLSFVYEDQDLSYRFTAASGIMRTMDNRQFTALLGSVAHVVSTSEIELINTDVVFHPMFDAHFAGNPVSVPAPAPAPAKAAPKKTKKAAATKAAPSKAAAAEASEPSNPAADYSPELCEKIMRMKTVSKKSYQYVAEKFDLPIDTIKSICAQYLKRPRVS